jgi:hypothetical protein
MATELRERNSKLFRILDEAWRLRAAAEISGTPASISALASTSDFPPAKPASRCPRRSVPELGLPQDRYVSLDEVQNEAQSLQNVRCLA